MVLCAKNEHKMLDYSKQNTALQEVRNTCKTSLSSCHSHSNAIPPLLLLSSFLKTTLGHEAAGVFLISLVFDPFLDQGFAFFDFLLACRAGAAGKSGDSCI